jgi:hypothetical protein
VSERVDYLEKLAREQGKFVRRDGDKLILKDRIKDTPGDYERWLAKQGIVPVPAPPMDWAETDLRAHEPTDGEEAQEAKEAVGILVGPLTQWVAVNCLNFTEEEWVGKYLPACLKQLRELAEDTLKPGSVYEIQVAADSGGSYRAYRLAWVHTPWLARALLGPIEWPGQKRDGYVSLGAFKIPGAP